MSVSFRTQRLSLADDVAVHQEGNRGFGRTVIWLAISYGGVVIRKQERIRK